MSYIQILRDAEEQTLTFETNVLPKTDPAYSVIQATLNLFGVKLSADAEIWNVQVLDESVVINVQFPGVQHQEYEFTFDEIESAQV